MMYLTSVVALPLFIYLFVTLIRPEWFGPSGGLTAEKFVNVLEVNLELCKRYGAPK
jgi:K+-transporting ATPase KdpF subunit